MTLLPYIGTYWPKNHETSIIFGPSQPQLLYFQAVSQRLKAEAKSAALDIRNAALDHAKVMKALLANIGILILAHPVILIHACHSRPIRTHMPSVVSVLAPVDIVKCKAKYRRRNPVAQRLSQWFLPASSISSHPHAPLPALARHHRYSQIILALPLPSRAH